jgi:hypothetical protein
VLLGAGSSAEQLKKLDKKFQRLDIPEANFNVNFPKKKKMKMNVFFMFPPEFLYFAQFFTLI